MSVTALGYFAVASARAMEWHRLLTEVLGMRLSAEQPGARFYKLDGWQRRIAVYEAEEEAVRAVGWQLADEAALEAMAGRLREAGVDLEAGTPEDCRERAVTRLYRFRDPASTMPSEIFFGPLIDQVPFSPDAGISGYVTGEDGLGHVVYFVGDYAGARDFYTRVMGFRTSDYIIWDGGEKDATFYHCNPRHHSLAIMPPFGDIAPGTFNHLMLQGRSINDVGLAWDRVRARGIPVMMELGKHTNDQTESFYLISPSGFGIEFGCNSLRVGGDWQVRTYDAPMIWGHQPPAVGA
jgi:3,4-dihydroxy-9,10-secoandrosta-1,3,5(10)-triene-9,17-dione 4,5-dioxygenase